MTDISSTTLLVSLIDQNERTVKWLYSLFAALLVAMLVAHLAFSSYFVYSSRSTDEVQFSLFVVFNVVAFVAEVFVSRIAFMLGSRAGQLRDLMYCLHIAAGTIDTARFESAARSVMSMRRDESKLKILELEALAAQVFKSKGKDADKA